MVLYLIFSTSEKRYCGMNLVVLTQCTNDHCSPCDIIQLNVWCSNQPTHNFLNLTLFVYVLSFLLPMFITLLSVKSPVKYTAECSSYRLVPNAVTQETSEYIKPGHRCSKLIQPSS